MFSESFSLSAFVFVSLPISLSIHTQMWEHTHLYKLFPKPLGNRLQTWFSSGNTSYRQRWGERERERIEIRSVNNRSVTVKYIPSRGTLSFSWHFFKYKVIFTERDPCFTYTQCNQKSRKATMICLIYRTYANVAKFANNITDRAFSIFVFFDLIQYHIFYLVVISLSYYSMWYKFLIFCAFHDHIIF